MAPSEASNKKAPFVYALSKSFDPRGMADDSYEERLACVVLEVHESICNEIYYYAEWWEIDADELLAASCGRHT
jgi:hypothetical protein